MITEFGKELRKLRIDRDETLMTMAKKLDISISYLSSIESGSRRVPDDLIDKLASKYRLSKKAKEKLETSKIKSVGVIELNIANNTQRQNDVMMALSRKIKTLTDEECEELLKHIK